MVEDRLAAAQRGVALAEVIETAPVVRAHGKRAAPVATPVGRAGAQAAADARRARPKGAPTKGAPSAFTGPFLSPSSLTKAERLKLVDGIERVIEGVFAHLPLKRARYGIDPVQRLRILRT